MTFAFRTLLAQTTEAAQGVLRETFEWGRIESNTDWILPVAICVAAMVFVWQMYRRDAAELHPVLGVFLTVLRTITVFGLLILYLDPKWRPEREITRNSQVLMAIDTSPSMKETDVDEPIDGATTRLRQVAAALTKTDLLAKLRQTHDVDVYRFNETMDKNPVCSLTKIGNPLLPAGENGLENPGQGGGGIEASAGDEVDWYEVLQPAGEATQLGLALQQLVDLASGRPVSAIIVFTDGGQNSGVAPGAAVSLAKKLGIPIFTVGIGSERQRANVRVSGFDVPKRIYALETEKKDQYEVAGYLQSQEMDGKKVRVELFLHPSDGNPGAWSPDGQQPAASSDVTLGEEKVQVKFKLTPGDPGRYRLHFRVKPPADDAYPDDNSQERELEIVNRKTKVLLLAGGPTREYRFLRTQLKRDHAVEVHVLLQTAEPGISQEADKILDEFPADTAEMAEYDCLVAFDPDWQELGETRAESKERADLLEKWVAEEAGGLIVVAGPVYTTSTIGGWLEDPDMAGVRKLYPVEFRRGVFMLDEDSYRFEEPCLIEFSEDGNDARCVMLDDSLAISRRAWEAFDGVYSFCPVRREKAAATVLARFAEPGVGGSQEKPVYMAEQFYGSGRTFYLGSGEMWRLRKLDEAFFGKFYLNLIRHVSQGRQARDSSHGMLMVEKDQYLLGDTVSISARLKDAQQQPLQVPEVTLRVVGEPRSSSQDVQLQAVADRPGEYSGQFPAQEKGRYRLELQIPGVEDERLTENIEIDIPQLEAARPQRDRALLTRIAEGTWGARALPEENSQGEGAETTQQKTPENNPENNPRKAKAEEGPAVYYNGVAELFDPPALKKPIDEMLIDRTRTDVHPERPDREQRQNWLMWMMIALCGLLCVEWLTRRLAKLA